MILDRWLITGGAGFVGRHFAHRLAAEGKEVLIVDCDIDRLANCPPFQNSPVTAPDSVIAEEFGVLNETRLSNVIRSFRPNVIVHLAAVSTIQQAEIAPREAMATNVFGTSIVCRLAALWGIPRVIHSSSSSVYGNLNTPFSADTVELNPVNTYGDTKLRAEEIANVYGRTGLVSTVNTRLFNVYGPGGKGVVDTFLGKYEEGLPFRIHGDGDQRRDFIHVQDVVNAFICLATLPVIQGPVNVGSGYNHSINELAKMIDPEGLTVNTDVSPWQEPRRTKADNRPLASLGWSQISNHGSSSQYAEDSPIRSYIRYVTEKLKEKGE